MYAWRKFVCQCFVIYLVSQDAAYYKIPENPSSIDLILRNKSRNSQKFCFIETGLSKFHGMVITVMKTPFKKLKPKVINYRDFKSFENKLFWENLLYELSNAALEENADGFEEFIEMCQKKL